VIPRYTTPEMNRIWSDSNKLSLWFQVELASVWAYESLGRVPAGVGTTLERAGSEIDFDALFKRALEIEESTKHDVIAFLTALEEKIGDASRYIHYGLTSSDIVDTAFALQLVAAGRQIEARLTQFRTALYQRALQHKGLACLGRTHGQAAELTTFGLKLLGYVTEVDRNLERLKSATKSVSVGKMSGAVGNYANSDPMMEEIAMKRLGLSVETVATQVVCRDRHAEFFTVLGIIAGSLERLAVEIRLLAHVHVKEAFEPFGSAQRGSSAMPHKRNPILTENITGLARLVRGYASMSLENQALWHERDISHSSVERVIAPDATQALDFAIKRMTLVITGLEVSEENMKKHVDETMGAMFSETILLLLVNKGVLRQEAYGWVQSAAKKQKAEGISFESALLANIDIAQFLSGDQIKQACDVGQHLKHVEAIFKRVVS